jgi:hypothetical protein
LFLKSFAKLFPVVKKNVFRTKLREADGDSADKKENGKGKGERLHEGQQRATGAVATLTCTCMLMSVPTVGTRFLE